MKEILLVAVSVVMFGGCFALNDVYRKLRSSCMASSLESAFIGSIAGLTVLLSISGFDFQATPFTICIALLSAVIGIAFTYCSFRALDRVNLSLYSLFSMLGGMALPFFLGIFFYGERISVSKIVCFILVCTALLLTVSNDNTKKGIVYCIAIFVLNGMIGVLSTIYASAAVEKTSAEWFSIWISIFTAAISGGMWLLLREKSGISGYTWWAFGVSAINGAINRVANYLLVIALVHLDASVQYPMVTGGVIVVSTVICYWGKSMPSKKELFSIVLAFIGILTLFYGEF